MRRFKKLIKIAFIFLLIINWLFTGWPPFWHYIGLPSTIQKAHASSVTVVLTSGTTWTVPPAWDNTANTIEAIGAGGNGDVSTASTNSGAGGGGGEYRKVSNVTLTPNSTVSINISAGGAGSSADGTWLEDNSSTKVIEAMNGGNASGTTPGAGGTGGIGSAANYNGGAGGAGATGAEGSGGGGGGSAGPVGIGQSGAAGTGGTGPGGGGGGGSDGGSSTAGSTGSGTSGGAGGSGTGGTGSGGGGTKNATNAGTGSAGGGGGGGGEGTGSGVVPGAAGGSEDLWNTGEGPSGGGGGGGGAGGTGATGDKSGGAGGTYGGGAGGAGFSGAHTFSGGTGGQGIIVITYTPSLSSSISQADYRLFDNPSTLGTPWVDCRTEGGETTIPSGSSSSTVTLGTAISDMNQAFLLVNASGDSNVTGGNDHMVAGTITNTTTLTFTRGASSGSDAQVSYSLVECFQNEFSVQRGETTIASGASSNTASISPVDASQSMVIVSSYDDDTTADEQTGLATGSLQDNSTVLLERYDTPAVNDTVDWQVITFSSGSGATVQTGETTLASGDSSDTATISSVDTGSSWLYCAYDADSNGLQQDAVGCDLTDATTLTFNRYSAKAYNNGVRWYVVSFPSDNVSVQRGNQADGGGTTDGVRYDVEIPLSTTLDSVTSAFPFITNTASGTGTAFPRDDWIYDLTSTGNLETSYWRGSSSGAGSHYWQVIEFLPPSQDVGSPLAAQNTAATLASTGRSFRLRMLLGVSDATLAEGSTYKLQYAQLSGSCGASTYADVTTSTAIAYHDINGMTDGIAMTTDANDPVDGSNTIDPQDFVESNNFQNDQSIISPGEDGEWDFSLKDNGAPSSTTYCFRAVKSSGTALDAYSIYPEVTTSAPSVVSVSVSNGTVSYGYMPLNTSKDTTSSELNDTQTVTNDGNVAEDFYIEGQNTSCPWTLSDSNGANLYEQDFSTDSGSSWTPLTTSLQTLVTDIASNDTQNLDLRLTTPTSSTCLSQQSTDVTIEAVAN